MLEFAVVPPVDRPFVLANVAMSIDGKIAVADRSFAAFSSRLDRDRVDELRSRADAVLIGGGTLRHEDPPLQIRDPARRRDRRNAGRDELLTVVVLSASGRVPAEARAFREPARETILLTTAAGARRVEPGLPARVEILAAGEERVDLRAALSALRRRGIETLLVEGGGAVNAAFFSASLLDELHLTLCPVIVGGAASPTPVEGDGFDASDLRRARLEAVERKGEEIFLRYAFPSPR